jgi:uncharacterized RDD family membrane protein YckC
MHSAQPSVNDYVHAVLAHIPRTWPDRQRIQEDLRIHIAERVEAGNSVAAAIIAMGDPREVARSYLSERPLRYASIGRRVAAMATDYIVLVLILLCFASVGLYIGSDSLAGLGLIIFSVIAISIGSMLYFPIAEAVFGQTLGKRLLGLTVVTESGLAIGAREAIIRRIPYIFNAVILLDAIFVFFGEKHQRAFDRVAGTVVVQESP